MWIPCLHKPVVFLSQRPLPERYIPPSRSHSQAVALLQCGQLFEQQPRERDHRRDTRRVRAKAGVEAERPVLGERLGEALQRATERQLSRRRIGLHPLDLCLHVVEREGEDGAYDTGEKARARNPHARVLLTHQLIDRLLGLVVRRERAAVERHRAHDRRARAGPEGEDALGADDAVERIANALVVAPLRLGQRRVRLHTDDRQLGRVADHRAKRTRREPGHGLLPEGGRLTGRGLHHVDERAVCTEPRRLVRPRAQVLRRDARVKRREALRPHHPRAHRKRATAAGDL
mmetsp:Transcript_4257/g.13160  ORF Transcript_4257/g.13160 Transcript_4257/m.13160 type:complete len:289 (-) Transcript_4257:156-1022(-)